MTAAGGTSGDRRGATARIAEGWRTGPLAIPGFRLLAGGQFASTVGDYCYAWPCPGLYCRRTPGR